jgi:DNA-binding SARP family transcriptional activator
MAESWSLTEWASSSTDIVGWNCDLRLFDGFQLPGQNSHEVPAGVQRLLALVALRGGHIDRSTAAGMLWPNTAQPRAVGSLRSALWRTNQVAAGMLRIGRSMIELNPEVRVDIHLLEQQAARLRQGCTTESVILMSAPDGWDLLPGWDDPWVAGERERLHEVQLVVLTALCRALASHGAVDRAILLALRALAMDPLRESTQRLLIRLHIAAGDYGEALRIYARSRDELAAELGVSPSPRMTELLLSIPRHHSAGVRESLGGHDVGG